VKAKALLGRAAPVAGLVLGLDQATKVLVREQLPLCTGRHVRGCEHLDLAGSVHLVRIENAGSAFGFAQGWLVWILVAAVGVLLVSLYGRRLSAASLSATFAVGLQAGGALGNLTDRLLEGQVTDFIWLDRLPFIFNLADVALVLGMLLAVAAFALPRGESGGRVNMSSSALHLAS
jgi:signal peptidase II